MSMIKKGKQKVMKYVGGLKSNSYFMKYFKNTSWLFTEKILRMTVGLFVGIWVARYLGPEKFGNFAYAQSFVGLFTAIATLGLDGIIVRELVKNKGRRDEIIGTAFWLKVFGAIAVLFILAGAINFTSNSTSTNILIFIIASATIFQSFNVVDFYFQSKVLSKYVVYANIISLLLSSIFKVILILKGAPLIFFAIAIAFDSFVLASGLIYFYFRVTDFKLRNLKFKWITAIELLRDSWPLILSGVAVSVYMRIDQVMIKEILDNEAVGQYAAAVRLSEVWYFIPVVIATSLFPAIVEAKRQSEKIYYSRLQKLYSLMVWLAIGIALPMTFLSSWLTNLLYGGQYNQAGGVLMIHIWAGLFIFLGVAFNNYLTSENMTKKAFYRTLLGAVLNIVLNYILIPLYGIKGAAIATFMSQFFANYVYDILDKDLHQQFIMKTKSFVPWYNFKSNKK